MTDILHFPARLRLVPMPARADMPRLAALERALPAPLERFREMCGSDELTPEQRVEQARSIGAAFLQIAQLSIQTTI